MYLQNVASMGTSAINVISSIAIYYIQVCILLLQHN